MATKKIEEQDLLSDGLTKAINELSQVVLEVTVPSENNKEPELKSTDIEKDLDSSEDKEIATEVIQITFRMAKMWESKGHTHEAMDLYRKIIKRYKESNEAKEAKNSLLRFAKLFESEGRYHLAQSLYDEIFL